MKKNMTEMSHEEIQRALDVARRRIPHVSSELWEQDSRGSYILFAYPRGKESQKWEVTVAQMEQITEYLKTGVPPMGIEPRLLGQKRKVYKSDKGGGYKGIK